jgi:hypothetical protein
MTGAVACGSMSWVWPRRIASRVLGTAAATARAALRRNGGLFSSQITRAGIELRRDLIAGALAPDDLAALNALLQQVLTGIERRDGA